MSGVWDDPNTVALLRTMKAQGHAASAIARAVSHMSGRRVSRNAVIGKCVRLGLCEADKNPERIAARAVAAKLRGFGKVATERRRRIKGELTEAMSAEPISERGAQRGPHNIAFKDRSDSACLMFVGGESHDTGLICGRGVYGDKPYCKDCCKLAYLPPETKRRVA